MKILHRAKKWNRCMKKTKKRETVSRLWLTLNILKKKEFFKKNFFGYHPNLLTRGMRLRLLCCLYNLYFLRAVVVKARFFLVFTSYASCEYVAWQLIKVDERRERTWEGCMVTLKKEGSKVWWSLLGVLFKKNEQLKKWKYM